MIGLVLVSHSARLAAGVAEIVEQMVQGRVPLATAGGTDLPEAPIGTDPAKVLAALEAVYSAAGVDGVLVLMDLGSAIMSAEAAVEMLAAEQRSQVVLCEAPLVEGAVAAAVTAMTGGSLVEVLAEARGAYAAKTAHLTSLLHLPAPGSVGASTVRERTVADAPGSVGERVADAPGSVGEKVADALNSVGASTVRERTVADAPGSVGERVADAPGSVGERVADAPGSVGEKVADAPGSVGANAPGATLLLTIVVPNRLGLHARPAARLVSLAAQYDAQITLTLDTRSAAATSMNQVATLGARQGDVLVVSATGPQAEAALEALEALALDNFGDPVDARSRDLSEPGEIIATATEPTNDAELSGLAASEGIAFGPAFVYRSQIAQVQETAGADPSIERGRLTAAIADVAEHLRSVRADVLQRVGAGEAAIFDAHLLMVQDAELLQSALQEIELRRVNAEAAWQRALQALSTRYRGLPDPYQARRADDVLDVGQRVLRKLAGADLDEGGPALTQASILVAHELKPSDLARVQPDLVLGIVTELGSANDHSSILARALGLPAVTGVGPFLGQVEDGQTLALDGSRGCVWLAPTPDQLRELEQKGEARAKERAAVKQTAQRPAVTRNGRRILVAANINGPSDVAHALDLGAEGVGLFRTEYLFLDRVSPPTEEEQVDTYRLVARQLKGKPLVVRTLDVGGDKPLPYFRSEHEANPFLGRRGLRYSLDRPALFKLQLRAILRAAAEHPIKLMFPMVSTFDELVLVDALIDEACAELQGEGLPFDDDIARGIMVETPAAVLAADHLVRLVDFFSIGTNDLSQYMMAADRSNAAVANLVTPYQPAVLRAIHQVVEAAKSKGIPVSLCGEMAGDPLAAPLLIGLGIGELSMSAPAIPLVKARVREVDVDKAQVLAAELLTYESAVDVEARLRETT